MCGGGRKWRSAIASAKRLGVRAASLGATPLSQAGGFIELDDKSPHQFATLILERLATNEGKPTDHYTKQYAQQLTPPVPQFVIPPSSFSIPHNLPALQPFFGREEELRQIAVALEPESRTWGALIDGPGGMGKTSLAVKAALSVKPEVFERIVFVSLKSRELDEDGVRDLSGFILSGLTELLSEARLQEELCWSRFRNGRLSQCDPVISIQNRLVYAIRWLLSLCDVLERLRQRRFH